MPKLFSVSHDGKWSKDIRGYKFFIPAHYEKDPDGKHTEVQEKGNKENFITITVKDPIPIDHLDKMPDKKKDLKMLCEQAAEDLLKNDRIFAGKDSDESAELRKSF